LTIQLLLQSSVSGVVVTLLVSGLTVDILSTFCHGFVVQHVKLMLSKFLHLWFLPFDCFVRHQNVACLKRFTMYVGKMEDIMIVRLTTSLC